MDAKSPLAEESAVIKTDLSEGKSRFVKATILLYTAS